MNNKDKIVLEDKICCIHNDVVSIGKNKLLEDEVIYEMADFFKVFADSTRVKILYTLLDNELCVGDLSQILNMSQSAISHQLRVLRQNDLVKFRREGKSIIYSLDDDHVSILLKQSLEHLYHKKITIKIKEIVREGDLNDI